VTLRSVCRHQLQDATQRNVPDRARQDAGDHVHLSVRDAGVGLPPHDPHSLFDAFHTTKTGGMGIGFQTAS
jgi:C4-dicarboxylate-specific signal transduction histidine kinase